MLFVFNWLVNIFFLLQGLLCPVHSPGQKFPWLKPVNELGNPDSLYVTAKALIKREMYNEALPYFSKAGHLYKASGNYAQSVRSFNYNAEIKRYFSDNETATLFLDTALDIGRKNLFPDDMVFAECYRARGFIDMESKQYDSARYYLDLSLKRYTSEGNIYDTCSVATYYALGRLFIILGKDDSALIYLQRGLYSKLLTRHNKDYQLADLYYSLAAVYWNLGDPEKTISNANQAVALIYIIDAKTPFTAISYLSWLGYVSRRMGNYATAFNYFKQAEIISKQVEDKNSANDIDLLLSKGFTYIEMGDLDKGKLYCEEAIKLVNITPPDKISFLPNLYLELAYYYYIFDQNKESINYCLRGIQAYEKNSDGFIYITGEAYYYLAFNFEKLNDYKKAEYYYKKAIYSKSIPELDGKIYNNIVYTYKNYGNFLLKNNDMKNGLAILNKGLAIQLEECGPNHPVTVSLYNCMANAYLKQKDYTNACKYFQLALASASTSLNPSGNPDVNQILFIPPAYTTLKSKALGLKEIAENTNSAATLGKSLETFDVLLRLIQKNRISFTKYESQVCVSGSEKETFDQAIETAYALYKLNGKDYYKNKTFEYIERGRSAALLASMKEKTALSQSGIPDSLLKKEEALKAEIELHETEILTAKRSDNPNTALISKLETKIFNLKTDEEILITYIEENYPAYYSLKYRDQIAGIEDLRKNLTNNEVLLEYNLSGDKVFIVAVTSQDFEIYALDLPRDFDGQVDKLRKYLDEMTFISQDEETYAGFLEGSYGLYKLLVEPAAKLIGKRNIIVIPDDKLSTIPFEVLLTHQAGVDVDYASLPYLIESNAVSYAYSANLLCYNVSPKPGRGISMASFSPSYAELAEDDPESPNFRYRSFLIPLPYAKEEATMVSRIFGGDVFFNKDACESRFKKVAPRYDVLHLSMHAMVDDENPMYSNLAFGKSKAEKEDGYLNTFELFNMKLNARMAVLSACNTGVGALQKGEGIMSLARGFYFAGCPDVVMTLWPVEDKMSASLVKDFYQYLSEGKNKAEALRLAKLNFLKSSDPLRAHPYFWAGYVNIGDITPLVEKPREKSMGLLAWASLLGMLVLLLPLSWRFL